MRFIYGIKYKIPRKSAENLFPYIPKINFGLAQNTKLHVSLLCQVVQNTGGPKIQNTISILHFPALAIYNP